MKKRNGLSPRLRFEVFKRDGFRCVYCGATPVESVLHVDHVKPAADGGGDDSTNLVTACQACNGGKSSVPLETKRLGPKRTPEEATDHADQILAYLAAERGVVDAKEAVSDAIVEAWEKAAGWTVTPRERSFLSTGVDRYGMANMVDAIRVAAWKINPGTSYQSTQCFKYLCGIVRRWRETGDVTIGGTKRHFRGEGSGASTGPGPVDGLLSWLGVAAFGDANCELCARGTAECAACRLGPAGCDACTNGVRELKAYRILADDLKMESKPNNIAVLCPSCCRKNGAAFAFATEMNRGHRPAGMMTPRRLFFSYIETQKVLDDEQELPPDPDGSEF